jgi:glycosyltransferase involved in cell wall biosynthesis
MKVAISINSSWNIYNFRLNLVRSLLKQGYEVHTIAPTDGFTQLLVNEGCIHHHVGMEGRGTNPVKDAVLLLKLFLIYRKIRPDVILQFTIKPNIYGTLVARLLSIPTINNVCGLGTVFLKNNVTSSLAILLYKISFRFATRVFFQNPHDLSLFVKRKLVKEHKADVLPGSGINLQAFLPGQFKRNTKFTFLLIARLIADKGIGEYVAAIRRLRTQGIDARFQILGAVDRHNDIKPSQIEDWVKSDMIEYLGTTKDVRPFIHQADCIVLPSYREGTPRTLLEACCLSKPIVATNVPGCNYVVEHNYNGLLCSVRDANDLAEKMLTMTKFDNEQLKRLGANGRLKVESTFDEQLVIAKYLKTIDLIPVRLVSWLTPFNVFRTA